MAYRRWVLMKIKESLGRFLVLHFDSKSIPQACIHGPLTTVLRKIMLGARRQSSGRPWIWRERINGSTVSWRPRPPLWKMWAGVRQTWYKATAS